MIIIRKKIGIVPLASKFFFEKFTSFPKIPLFGKINSDLKSSIQKTICFLSEMVFFSEVDGRENCSLGFGVEDVVFVEGLKKTDC